MSVTINYTSKLNVTEVLEANVLAATDKTVQYGGYDAVVQATGASSPPATKSAVFEKALAAGVGTIDLTALVGTNGVTVDGSGLRVQFAKFRNKSTSTSAILIKFGAANPYTGFGATFQLSLAAGAEVLLRTLDAGADVAAGCKNLDLSSDDVDAILECVIVLG